MRGVWEYSDLAEPLLDEGSRSTFSQEGMEAVAGGSLLCFVLQGWKEASSFLK